MTLDHLNRRDILLMGCGVIAAALAPYPASAASVDEDLAAIEARAGGRLGVCAIDTGPAGVVGHRMRERFAMCSTFKLSLAAAILEQADAGALSLDMMVRYGADDIVANSPVTQANLAAGAMSVRALAEATQKTSDNTAANILLKLIDGPEGLTRFYRRHGDSVTRLDRFEPDLNAFTIDDPRDTTSPRAHAGLLVGLLTGPVLSEASRALLVRWMVDTQTGLKRIRAGIPEGWRAGDKTGTGLPGKYNDIAICWPPGRMPVVITAYYHSPSDSLDIRDEDQRVIADAARVVAGWVLGA
jgi:beta-lactamase class A